MAIINEGLQYRLLIDPFLDRVHSRAAGMIDPGEKVIDVACGNGTLALKLAERAGYVTGIDLSEGSLEFARKRARKLGLSNTEFLLQDANDLSIFTDRIFDVAIISMAVHQFSEATGLHILRELQRIARSIVVIDYAFPQPGNYKGFIVRSIERIAGQEHFSNFNAYMKGRGMEGVQKVLGLEVWERMESRSGVFVILKYKV